MSLLLMQRRTVGLGYLTGGLLTGLVAYWKLANVSDSVGANTLTNNNTVTFVAGKQGNCANFVAASSQSLTIADNAALSMGDIDFTISLHINFSGTGAQFFIGKGNGVAHQSEFYFSAFNGTPYTFAVANGTATGQVNSTATVPVVGTWYFVVGWHDSVANTVNIQVDNGVVNSTSFSGGSYDSALAFGIGRLGSLNSLYADAKIDEVGIWKRTLTVAERTHLFNNGAGATIP